jgi:cell division septum initiation protein DivIVA
MECEINSAMPGAEEALLLAQRIGIGRFVPCFLLFSDVGSPSVCLFPVARKSPEFVFERLRTWIDTFYEINNSTLHHWAKIEKSVEEISEAFKSSVYALSRWRNERSEAWNLLQRLSFHQHRLQSAAPSIAILDEIESDRKLTWEIRSSIRTFCEQWRSIEKRIENAHRAMKWVDKLKSMQNSSVCQAELRQFKEGEGSKLPESLRTAIEAALAAFTVPPLPLSPNDCVLQWWRSEHGRPLSRNRYDKHRHHWATYSKAKYGISAVGRAAEIRREEFTVVQTVVYSQPVNSDSTSAADEALLALAGHLSISPEEPSWRQAVSSYRDVLIDYFNRLKNNAPVWVMQFGSAAVPVLCWGECIPSVDQLQKNQHAQCLLLLTRLNAIVERASREWDEIIGIEERRRAEQQRVALTEVYSCVESWFSASNLLETDRLSIWHAVISILSGTRRDLEDKVFSQVKEAKAATFPGRALSRSDARHLLTLLDGYDQAVNSLVMPFENDRDVLRVSLDTPMCYVLDKRHLEEAVSPGARARNSLLKTASEAEEAIGKWTLVKREANENSPAGRLYLELEEILAPGRLEELRTGVGPGDTQETIAALSDRNRILRILDDLRLQELLALENRVSAVGCPSKSSKPDTKEEIVQSILTAIGLAGGATSIDNDRCDTKLLKEKASRGQFDVFLAHNSEDKASVLRLGSRLRSRGIYPWIDVEQVPPGRWFQDVLQSAIRMVKSAAIVIGSSGIGKWQAVEMKAFVSRCVESGIPIIPVLLPGTESMPAELTFLRELNYVRFEKDITEDAGISSLIWGITGKKPESL